jgi:hypothetical protein
MNARKQSQASQVTMKSSTAAIDTSSTTHIKTSQKSIFTTTQSNIRVNQNMSQITTQRGSIFANDNRVKTASVPARAFKGDRAKTSQLTQNTNNVSGISGGTSTSAMGNKTSLRNMSAIEKYMMQTG